MATVDTCTTPDEGWGLVSHFLGNILLVIRCIVNQKNEDWEANLSTQKNVLVSRLTTIARRMYENGHIEDSNRIKALRFMVENLDLSNPTDIESIHARHLEFNDAAREMKEAVRKMSGK